MAICWARVSGALVLACGMAGGAAAQTTAVVTAPNEERFTLAVSHADLDLALASDRKLLLRRVGRAVESVCSESLGPSPVYFAERSCKQWSWRNSRPQIDRAVSGHPASLSAATILVSAPRP